MSLILVGGMSRSGTTLLASIMDSHPDISGGAELIPPPIPDLPALRNTLRCALEEMTNLRDAGRLLKRSGDAVSGLIALRLYRAGLSHQAFEGIVDELIQFGHLSVNTFEQRLDFAARLIETRRLREQSSFGAFKLNSAAAHAALTLHPDAFLTAIIRHPLDVIDSHLRSNFQIPVPTICETWSKYVRAYEKAIDSFPERAQIVRYEDLVSEPRRTLQRLFDKLPMPWNDNVLSFNAGNSQILASRHPNTENLKRGFFTDSVGIGLKSPVSQHIEWVQKTCSHSLQRWGYDSGGRTRAFHIGNKTTERVDVDQFITDFFDAAEVDASTIDACRQAAERFNFIELCERGVLNEDELQICLQVYRLTNKKTLNRMMKHWRQGRASQAESAQERLRIEFGAHLRSHMPVRGDWKTAERKLTRKKVDRLSRRQGLRAYVHPMSFDNHSAGQLYFGGDLSFRNDRVTKVEVQKAGSLVPQVIDLDDECEIECATTNHQFSSRSTIRGQELDAGFYRAHLLTTRSRQSSPFFFNVLPDKNDRKKNAAAVLLPTFSWQAYNDIDAVNLYSGGIEPLRASLARPLSEDVQSESKVVNTPGFVFTIPEYIARLGVSFFTLDDLNLHLDETLLDDAKLLVIAGHSEYWTNPIYLTIQRHLSRGGHCLLLSGNVAWWRIHYQCDSIECYKNDGDPIEGLDRSELFIKTGCVPQQFFGPNWWSGGYPLSRNSEKVSALIGDLDRARQLIAEANGVRPLAMDHPIFDGVPLDEGGRIGGNVPVIFHEVDGIWCDQNGCPRPNLTPLGEHMPKDFVPLASSHLWHQRNGLRECVTAAELKLHSGAHVLNLGTCGWTRGVQMGDPACSRVVENSIRYLLALE